MQLGKFTIGVHAFKFQNLLFKNVCIEISLRTTFYIHRIIVQAFVFSHITSLHKILRSLFIQKSLITSLLKNQVFHFRKNPSEMQITDFKLAIFQHNSKKSGFEQFSLGEYLRKK